jgi:hypothetical protein
MLMTEFGTVGDVVSDVHSDKKPLLMLVIEFGIVGGVVSNVHPDRK